jgi:hypothetical protein
MSRRSFARTAAALVASVLLTTFATVLAGAQDHRGDKPQAPQRTVRTEKGTEKAGRAPSGAVEVTEAKAILDKMIDEVDLKPRPQRDIPDDPPPHEGALIDIPLVVEPPDLLLVEVLEALPGRPISGERLIRPDGKISLGFYGEVYVRGLTLPQIKVAIIKHLRKYLDDEILGLVTPEYEELPQPVPRTKPLVPNAPDDANPFNQREHEKAASPPAKPRASLGPRGLRGASWRSRTTAIAVRPARLRERSQVPEENKGAENKPNAIVTPFPGQGQVKITIEVQGIVSNGPRGPATELTDRW